MKFKLNAFVTNKVHIGPPLKPFNIYNTGNIYKLNNNFSVIDLKKTLLKYKIILPLIAAIAKNKGKVYLEKKVTHSQFFTNKDHTKFVPSFVVLFHKSKENIAACNKLTLPCANIAVTMENRTNLHTMYNVLANTESKQAIGIQSKVLTYAIKKGIQMSIIEFKKTRKKRRSRRRITQRYFPRLDSNQRPRT